MHLICLSDTDISSILITTKVVNLFKLEVYYDFCRQSILKLTARGAKNKKQQEEQYAGLIELQSLDLELSRYGKVEIYFIL